MNFSPTKYQKLYLSTVQFLELAYISYKTLYLNYCNLNVTQFFILRRKRRSSQCFFKPSRVSHGLIARHTRSVVCFIKTVYLALYRLHFLQTLILFHCNGCIDITVFVRSIVQTRHTLNPFTHTNCLYNIIQKLGLVLESSIASESSLIHFKGLLYFLHKVYRTKFSKLNLHVFNQQEQFVLK